VILLNAAENIRDEALFLLALGRNATAHGGTVSRGRRGEKSTIEQVPTSLESSVTLCSGESCQC
jgi:hypothetical protein